jgi:Restriction endonuclease NaeI
VQAVTQQKDYMKQLRKNGGARDALAGEGIVILSGSYDNLLIAHLGLERTGRDGIHFIQANIGGRHCVVSEGRQDRLNNGGQTVT